MDILLLYNIDFNKAFRMNEHGLVVETLDANKFITKWGFMIELITGHDIKDVKEMSRVYAVGCELKQRMETLRNTNFSIVNTSNNSL